MPSRQPSPRRVALRVIAATAVAAAGLAGCGTESPTPGATTVMTSEPDMGTASTGPSTSGPATSTGTSSAGEELRGIPIYWLGKSRGGFALFREFRTVADRGGPVESAVAAMTTMTPLDPDYSTPWKHPSSMTVTRTGAAITVDLSADAFSGTDVARGVAELAVQQLVWTATAAAAKEGTPARTVRILIDGAPGDAWGVVPVGTPMTRGPMADVQAHAWVTSPQEGDSLPAGPVTFTGFGTSFEANFIWKVTDASGAVVADGSAMGGDGAGGFGKFTFTATLPVGAYSVEVSTDDPSGGTEGKGAAIDTKGFTVT